MPIDIDFLVGLCLEPYKNCLDTSKSIVMNSLKESKGINNAENFEGISEVVRQINNKKQLGFLKLSQDVVKGLRRKFSSESVAQVFELTLILFYASSAVLNKAEEIEDEAEEVEEEDKEEEDDDETTSKKCSTAITPAAHNAKQKKFLQNIRRLSLTQIGNILKYFPEETYSAWSMKLMQTAITNQIKHLTAVGKFLQEKERVQLQLQQATQAEERKLWKEQKQLEKEQAKQKQQEDQQEKAEEKDQEAPRQPIAQDYRPMKRGAPEKALGSHQAAACLKWFLAMTSCEKLAKQLTQEQGSAFLSQLITLQYPQF